MECSSEYCGREEVRCSMDVSPCASAILVRQQKEQECLKKEENVRRKSSEYCGREEVRCSMDVSPCASAILMRQQKEQECRKKEEKVRRKSSECHGRDEVRCSMDFSPCALTILMRQQEERERRKKEEKVRREKERIQREKKEIERREKELTRREPYICPGQANIEKTAIKEAKIANVASQKLMEDPPRRSPISPVIPIGPAPVTTFKDQELRGGVFYSGCDCNRRNGLQDDCQRIECLGRPACLTDPPMCIPSGGIGYISPCYPICEPACYEKRGMGRGF
jgi:hypothetical protein